MKRLYPAFVSNGIWLIHDAFNRYKWKILVAVLLGFIGVACQGASLSILHNVAGLFSSEADPVLAFGDYSFEIERTDYFFSLGGAFLVLLLLSGFMRYIYQRQAIVLWRKYQLALNHRILKLTLQAVNERRIDGEKLEWNPLYSYLMSISARRLGLLFRRLILSVESFIRFIFFLALGFYFNVGIAASLVVTAVIVGAFVVLKFGRHSSVQMRRLGERNRVAAEQWKQGLDSVSSGSSIDFTELTRAEGPIGVYLTTFQARFENVIKSHLMTLLSMVALLFVVFIFFGVPVMEGDLPWQELLVAVLAVVMAMFSLTSLAGTAATFGRFYPDVEVHRAFLKALESSSQHDEFEKKISNLRVPKAGGMDDEEI